MSTASTAPLGRPITSVAQQHAALSPINEAVARRDWPAALDRVAVIEPDLQFAALQMIGEMVDDAGAADVEAFAGGGLTLPKMIAAAALIQLAWKARTSDRATKVSREQFATFHGYLRQAEQRLIEVTAHEPGNATAWTLRLMTARGLQLGQNEARRRYSRAVTAVLHFYPAQMQLLQQLCPKWSGSLDAMHAFARECAFAAPPGSANGALVAEGHIERWLDLDGSAAGVAHLRQPVVQQEVMQAAGHSVLHPSFRAGAPGWIWAHNTFAIYWSLVGNHAAAARHFGAVGDYVHEFPWSYLGEPATVFTRYRRKALGEG